MLQLVQNIQSIFNLTDTHEITSVCQYLKLLVKMFLIFNLISVTIFTLPAVAEFQLQDNRNLSNCEVSRIVNIMQSYQSQQIHKVNV